MKKMRWLAMLLALAMVAAACGSGGGDADSTASGDDATGEEDSGDDSGDSGDAEEVDATQGSDLTFHVITHGDSGTFWSVVETAVSDAADQFGVEVVYFGANNDAAAQSQAIEQAIADGSAGIAISLADPDGLEAAANAVVDAGIPLYTLNSGSNDFVRLGATTHLGQDEFVAGQGAGNRFNDLGATTVLCAFQEQSNVGLEERCNGLADTFSGTVISEFIGLDAEPEEQVSGITAQLNANPDIDGLLGTGPNVPLRALEAAENSGVELIIGSFDLSEDLINEIDAGTIAFTVDQQQYLQGYLPVVLMFLEATNENTAGGGNAILTGPGFVTPDNAAAVAELVGQGTR